MKRCPAIHGLLSAGLLAAAALPGARGEESGIVQVRQDFARDPAWLARNNRPPAAVVVRRTQDFGFSPTPHAGGGGPGEIGGRIERSVRPAYYAKVIPPRTLQDRLQASGTFSVTQCDSGGGVLIGWFNSSSRGWRMPDSLVFRIDTDGGQYRVFFEYGTRRLQTGGGAAFEGRWQDPKTPPLPADGRAHAWSLSYDPQGGNGSGEITFTLDGKPFTAGLDAGHKAEGATFDRFGIMNVQLPGGATTFWLDDLTIDGQRERFDADPGWEGVGHRATFSDGVARPNHDFGHCPSNHAGGGPGEVGGLMWRIESRHPEQACYYAAPVGRLSLDRPLQASGRLCLRAAAADSAILFGWFNTLTAIGAPPANFLGGLIEGPSEVGHYVRPACGTATAARVIEPRGPVLRPDGRPHRWSMRYDPAANDSHGRIALTLDDETVAMNLDPAVRRDNAAFDAFGFVSFHVGGHYVEICFDDLEYTANK